MEHLQAALIDVPGVQVRVVRRCASTNTALLAHTGMEKVLLAAEEQTAGRGQRGRRWHSVPGSDVAFSLGARVLRPVRELGALSLVAGASAAAALRSLGVSAVSLKWPNDLMVAHAKLGGILVETRTGVGATHAVFGVGINCFRDPQRSRRVRRSVASLDEFIRPSRNGVIACLARSLVAALERFEAEGFGTLRAEWEAMDVHAGQRLRVRLPDGRTLSGIGGGLAADGALRLITRGGEHPVHSGRIVSARPA
jgi:BirA family biotin operon repressor/biotin-[acetyl-CoA-carboxylase] ligase